jgi:tetratricopeptide (TPR) repeat protein
VVSALLLTLVAAVIIAGVRSSHTPPPGQVSTQSLRAAGTTTAVAVGTSPVRQASPDEWKKTLATVDSLLENDAQNRDLLITKALALYNLGRLDEAQKLLQDLLAKNEDAKLRDRLGNILRDRGDVPGAEAAYQRALDKDPKVPGPYANLAELWWRERRTQEALDLLATGLRTVAEGDRAMLRAIRDTLTASARATTTSSLTTQPPSGG